MLYDPKWEQKTETKADPMKLETLIAWLEKQPANGWYEYGCIGKCLIAQYFTAKGFVDVSVGIDRFTHGPIEARECDTKFPDAFNDIAIADAFERQWTYGAALKRARKLASQSA